MLSVARPVRPALVLALGCGAPRMIILYLAASTFRSSRSWPTPG